MYLKLFKTYKLGMKQQRVNLVRTAKIYLRRRTLSYWKAGDKMFAIIDINHKQLCSDYAEPKMLNEKFLKDE